jgi:YD repeat-containing protein
MGNLTGTKDAEGNKITHKYDSMGRKVKTIKHFNDGQDITTEFSWYPNNKIHTIKDAKGNITEYNEKRCQANDFFFKNIMSKLG